ncbi:MAG: c-type cytochrome biogenesis protein CcmI, partial [Pseudomonadota bacterium]|nr:c-type cytochrome biogenesis protein CcmI [Pseudomonadota bacterium]
MSMLWVVFAIVTLLVLAAIVWPFFRWPAQASGSEPYGLAVYRDQLAELEADEASRLISPGEAEAARNEVSRRLLAAASAPASPAAASSSRAVAIACALTIPVLAFAVYLVQGRPDLPGVPYAERIASAVANNDIVALMVRVEAHLAERPDDVDGWRAIAPAYRALGRYDDAAKAFARILSLSQPSAALHADLGEALTQGARGLVTGDAVKAFDEALRLDPENVKARFFRALAHQQDGASDVAVSQWQALLASAPAGAPWRDAVEAELARAQMGTVAPELSQEQLAANQSLSPEDRLAMIRSMVDGLAQR